MATTRWAEVVDALVETMRSTSGFRAPSAAGSGIPVYDSVEVDGQEERPIGTYLVVAYPGDVDSPTEGGRSTQTPGPMGTTRPMDEDGSVELVAVVQTGDHDGVSAVRAAAVAVMAAVESALRSDPTLGGVVYWCLPEGGSSFKQYLADGIVVEVAFAVNYYARV